MVLYFLHNTSVLSFYIDVVLTLSIMKWNRYHHGTISLQEMLSKATQKVVYIIIYSGIKDVFFTIFQKFLNVPVPDLDTSQMALSCGCGKSCLWLPARWASTSLATTSNVSSILVWMCLCKFAFCDQWLYIVGNKTYYNYSVWSCGIHMKTGNAPYNIL